ncbi:Cell division protein FtsQ [Vibrio ruber DSM 16370]|uniref:Cell division protein FtsQ n=1 Tax=Vibrio ruber (strain DSM 16370 / JCM 11486 / BCRC 17186 / CECT 7878 / LMG 23124 / VR1) TaxID=1123498 RepID=A0A1R4LH15_VIBR1|nr:cell division protein FtsQ/DivIB [Vibrio ruber]SJN55820.1 Cell division protein FtsQ [Vibrio ruber DSM 16370]
MKQILMRSHQLSLSPWLRERVWGGIFLFSVTFFIGLLLYSALSWMWDEDRLPLSRIVLQGHLNYVTAHDVQQAFATLDHVGTFMSQDVDQLQRRVQMIPWVEHASIRKQWPDTIKVFLTEHQVQAIWNGQSLLDDHGVVFHGDLGLVQGEHVKLYGPENSSVEVLDMWRKYNPEFQKLGLNISSLLLNERRAWQIILDNGIRLELGKESIKERIMRFVALYRYFGQKAEKISYIDLRYDTGAAVGWFSEQELEQENTTDDKNDR